MPHIQVLSTQFQDNIFHITFIQAPITYIQAPITYIQALIALPGTTQSSLLHKFTHMYISNQSI